MGGVGGTRGTRSYELGRRLVAMGHKVDMVTSDMDPSSSATTGYHRTNEDGIDVHWLPVPYSKRMTFRKRFAAFLHFALASVLKTAALEGDVIFSSSGPLSIAIPAIFGATLKRKPLVFEVRDLWPEGAIQLGVLKNPAAIYLARALELFAYRFSRHIVALSPGMKAGIVATGIPENKVTVIPNACDLNLFHPEVDGAETRKKFNLEGKFSLAYFGTMSLANGLSFVLDSATELKRRRVDDIVFILHGDGMERATLEKRAGHENLKNVIFSDPIREKRKIAELVAGVDVCMTIYRNVPILASCSPNKLFDAFAAGKPSLVNMPGALQRLVEENQCGVFVEPDNPVDFADKVIALKQSPGTLEKYGRNARALGERMFSRDVLAERLGWLLESVVATGKGPCPPLDEEWK